MDAEQKSPNHQTKIALKKLEYDYLIARLGLQGTLWGAWASLVAIVAIVAVQVITERYIIQGWALAATVATIVVSVTAYGAFIFHSALTISVNIEKNGPISFFTNVGKNKSGQT
jgi:hypothetical protein